MGQILRLQRLSPFLLRMTSWEDCFSLEALAEISRFVAGLVQSVPKKPNEMKADLQNSTAYFKGYRLFRSG